MAGTANSGGRNALTPEEHKKRGSWMKSRHEGFDTVATVNGEIETPDDLEGYALAEWNRMVVRLGAAKILSKTDDAVIYAYAKVYEQIRQADDDVKRLRSIDARLMRVVDGLKGIDLVNALHELCNIKRAIGAQSAAMRNALSMLRQYLIEFGMTPSARTRVKLPKSEKNDSKLSRFIS